MTARAIVRDPELLDGRWHFEGTSAAVADVVTDYAASATSLPETYRFAGLTDEEVQAALTFEFPEVKDLSVTLEYGSVEVHCVCGEHTQKTGVWPLVGEIECPCRRTWRVTVEPVPGANSRSNRDPFDVDRP